MTLLYVATFESCAALLHLLPMTLLSHHFPFKKKIATEKKAGKSSLCKEGQQEHTVEMDVGKKPMNSLESLPFPSWNGIHTWKIYESALLGD